jgi:hypothetical protein
MRSAVCADVWGVVGAFDRRVLTGVVFALKQPRGCLNTHHCFSIGHPAIVGMGHSCSQRCHVGHAACVCALPFRSFVQAALVLSVAM